MNRLDNPAFALFADFVLNREIARAIDAEARGASEAVLTAYENRISAQRYFFFESNSDGGVNSGFEIGVHTPDSLKTGLSKQGKMDTWTFESGKRSPSSVEVKTNGGRIGSLLPPMLVQVLEGTLSYDDLPENIEDWGKRDNPSRLFVYALFQCNSTTNHEPLFIEPRIIAVNDLLKAIANNPQWVKKVGDDWAIQPAGRGWKPFVRSLPEVWKVTNL